MKKDCLICDRINEIKAGTNKYFVKELSTGYVVLGDTQFQKGYTLFLYKDHFRELHELGLNNKAGFLLEMAEVADAVRLAFKPDKLNYELLGNGDEHMHWHIIPRYKDEPHRTRAYWSVPKEIRNDPANFPSDDIIKERVERLWHYL